MSIRPPLSLSAGSDRLRRLGLPLLAGTLVTVGALTLMAGTGGDASSSVDLFPTVVAARRIAPGTRTDDLAGLVELRELPATARAEGAVSSLDALPGGTTVGELVPGQQVLASSIADDPIDAIGDNLVAVSVRLDPQRWTGPFTTTGATVDIYETADDGTELIVTGAQIVNAPDTTELDPRSEAVITLAVPTNSVAAVIAAGANGHIWMVGR